jgi:hypothetical protein
MYVCMCVYTHVCALNYSTKHDAFYAHIYSCLRAYIYDMCLNMYVYMYVYTHVCACVHRYVCIHICVKTAQRYMDASAQAYTLMCLENTCIREYTQAHTKKKISNNTNNHIHTQIFPTCMQSSPLKKGTPLKILTVSEYGTLAVTITCDRDHDHGFDRDRDHDHGFDRDRNREHDHEVDCDRDHDHGFDRYRDRDHDLILFVFT